MFTLDNIPRGLRGLARVLMQRDGIDAFDAHEQIETALDELSALLIDNIAVDDADFMSEHFGLEPDYFIALLNEL